jgi:hypothetical protein
MYQQFPVFTNRVGKAVIQMADDDPGGQSTGTSNDLVSILAALRNKK